MDKCEFLGTCAFYKNNSGSDLIESYCNSAPLRCARYMIVQSLGEEKVPDDLKPDEKATAYAILAEA